MRYILHWVREGLVHCPDSPRGCGECERLLWRFAMQSGLTTTTHKRRKFWYNIRTNSEDYYQWMIKNKQESAKILPGGYMGGSFRVGLHSL